MVALWITDFLHLISAPFPLHILPELFCLFLLGALFAKRQGEIPFDVQLIIPVVLVGGVIYGLVTAALLVSMGAVSILCLAFLAGFYLQSGKKWIVT